MEDIIHLLPDSVANQIAAGEVVQRPSSIIKEMVENSIDAGAKNIQVLVVDGGKTNVQIIDDGKGMSETDARLSFERHATSKISTASDLFNLTTMGFRGEALASIAAVAQVELTTRREEDELGTFIQISGSKIEKQELVSCAKGSNFSVKNLFWNIPARRKFLKTNQTELTSVVQEFERMVLVHPDISFTMYNNGVEMYRLPDASVRQRILDVFGKKLNNDLLPIDVETSLVSVTGYISKPESSKKKGARKYFFVNGRYMRHPYFESALMRAYDGLIPPGEQVPYFVYFSVDPSTIDVNVHPTKTEIKFDNEQPIWQVLYATVKETLGKFSNVPMIDFDVEGKPEIPTFGSGRVGQSPEYNPSKQPSSSYNPFKSTSESRYESTSNWESLYDGIKKKDNDVDLLPSDSNLEIGTPDLFSSSGNSELMPSDSNVDVAFPNTPYIYKDELSSLHETSIPKFQYKGRYIVIPSSAGLMMVDQHRAHVRVLFEQYMTSIKEHKHPTQKILFPIIVQFTKNESVILGDILDDIASLGFDISDLGGCSYSINGLPAGMENINPDVVLHDMVDSALERMGNNDDVRESIAVSLAKSTSIEYGQYLSGVEMNNLIRDLFALSSSARTPDGKKIYSYVELKYIEGLF